MKVIVLRVATQKFNEVGKVLCRDYSCESVHSLFNLVFKGILGIPFLSFKLQSGNTEEF